MKRVKYIVVESAGGNEVPIIFSDLLAHNEVAGNRTVISAGFVQIYPKPEGKDPDGCSDVWVSCFGESVTLKVKSRDDVDAKLILDRMFKEY